MTEENVDATGTTSNTVSVGCQTVTMRPMSSRKKLKKKRTSSAKKVRSRPPSASVQRKEWKPKGPPKNVEPLNLDIYDAVGPRTVHSPESKLEHAERWAKQEQRHNNELRSWNVNDDDVVVKEPPRKEPMPGHPVDDKVRRIASVSELQLEEQQKHLELKRSGHMSANCLVEPTLAAPAKSPIVTRKKPPTTTSGTPRQDASYANNHLQLLQRQSAELRQKDKLITKLYQDIDARTMAANAAEQRASDYRSKVESLEVTIAHKDRHLQDLHLELQTNLEQHVAELVCLRVCPLWLFYCCAGLSMGQ